MGKKVRYDLAVISYIDILGFRNLIETKSAGEISRVVRKLKERTKPDKEESRYHGMKFFNFSDTAIRITPVINPKSEHSRGNLFWELLALVHVQYLLILEKIIVRGAVSIGEIVKSWGVVYGPGLVSAYETEQRASSPRIIVDPAVFKHLRMNPALWVHDYTEEHKGVMNLLCKDEDGKLFIDYLRSIESEMDTPEVHYPRFIRTHADLIAEGLIRYRLNRDVVRKFKWLQKYHNSTVRNRFGKGVNRTLLV
ncbi:MAG: hypothetical protein LAO76_24910 [Acidobacteriia bacterium]|nr:hypothetical protein [Terriglobia bacterium]